MPVLKAAKSSVTECTTARAGAPSLRSTIVLAARIAGVLMIAASAVAVVVGVAFAGAARRWLAYPFTGIPARSGEVVAIFAHNLRALVAVGGVLLIAQSPYLAGKTAGGRLHHALQRAGECVLAAGVAANVVVVGASIGAYGQRMLRAILPHGPVELAAYALALALCLEGRNRPLLASHTIAIVALSTLMLALAAALETFVNL